MIAQLHHPAPVAAAAPDLLVMLPGIGMAARDFADHGLVAALHRRHPTMAAIAVRPDLDLYLDDRIAAALHQTVIAPARPYRRLFLLGISLGGTGALRYASLHASEVAGILLLAPFLGTQGCVAEIAAAGGLAAWSAAPAAGSVITPAELAMLRWLRHRLAHPDASPPLHLGYGQADRFAPASRLLAEALPASNVATAPGGHDWPTWLALWDDLLTRAPLARAPFAAAG